MADEKEKGWGAKGCSNAIELKGGTMCTCRQSLFCSYHTLLWLSLEGNTYLCHECKLDVRVISTVNTAKPDGPRRCRRDELAVFWVDNEALCGPTPICDEFDDRARPHSRVQKNAQRESEG